jgi:hypothetical protein
MMCPDSVTVFIAGFKHLPGYHIRMQLRDLGFSDCLSKR